MKAKLERTTRAERDLLIKMVRRKISKRQGLMDSDISIMKGEYPNIRKVSAFDYNVRNLFIEMNILDLYVFYANATSDRKQFHFKNENYKKLINAFGL